MFSILKSHIERLLGTVAPDTEELEKFFLPLQLKKKENLLVEGKVCKANYFVVHGWQRGDSVRLLLLLHQWGRIRQFVDRSS